jgi:hypothetical protein
MYQLAPDKTINVSTGSLSASPPHLQALEAWRGSRLEGNHAPVETALSINI